MVGLAAWMGVGVMLCAPAMAAAQTAAAGAPVTGAPDTGVSFLVVVDNPNVRVLQVTVQPGASRRPHVHNDVTFHILIPVTGSLELTVEKDPVVTAVQGQAYYMLKGQVHGFTNKTAAAVQAIEVFVKPQSAPAAP